MSKIAVIVALRHLMTAADVAAYALEVAPVPVELGDRVRASVKRCASDVRDMLQYMEENHDRTDPTRLPR